MNEINPFAIPNHSSLSMPMHSLKKVRQKLLKLEIGKEALIDGHTDGRTLERNDIYPATFCVAVYENDFALLTLKALTCSLNLMSTLLTENKYVMK